MGKFEEITERFGTVRWMDERRALVVKEIIEKFDVQDILEIGFLHGKSSVYFAGILEDRGKGRVVTIDLEKAHDFSPNITQLLTESGLAHRVEPIFAHRSFTWELARMIVTEPRPQFDFCYLDGGKTWDTEGFAFFLIDMLLKPGGLLLFDDIYWTLADSADYKKHPEKYAHYDTDELSSQSIRLIWEELVPHLGYRQVELFERYQWGLAQKPYDAADGQSRRAPAALASKTTGLERLLWGTGRAAKKRLKRLF